MVLYGIQKLTLLDYPGKVACTLFTAGCNFRCPFCYNVPLVLPGHTPEGIGEDEILSYLTRRQGILDGVCITGGEPTLQPELPDLIRTIRSLGYAVKLDTNGSRPEVVRALMEEGLVDYVAMDIKNALSRYPETAGVSDLNRNKIRETAQLLMTGNTPFEFRTTVVRPLHDEASFREIGSWLAGEEAYFLQGFQGEGELIGTGLTAFDREKLESFRQILAETIPNVSIRGI